MADSLKEFEAWCYGKGRGKGSGIHWTSIDAIKRFRLFKKDEKGQKIYFDTK